MRNIYFLLIVILLGGCSETVVENKPHALPTEVKLEFTLPNGVATKVKDKKWEPNDKIGLFMVNSDDEGELIAENYCYVNQDKIATESGSFVLDEGLEPLYYPSEKRVDFLAYYPFEDELAEYEIALDLTDQLQVKDILVAKAEAEAATGRVVNLRFAHRLVLIEVVVEPGTGIDPSDIVASNLSFKVENVPLRGKYHLLNDSFVEDAEAYDMPLLTSGVDEAGNVKYRGFILPMADMDAHAPELSLRLNNVGKEFSMLFKSAKTTSFEAGNKYTYRVALNAKGVSFVSSTIGDRILDEGGFIEGIEEKHPELKMEYQLIYQPLFYMGMKGDVSSMKQHRVELSSYYIARYEVTAEQFAIFLNSISAGIHITAAADTFAIVNGYNIARSEYSRPTGVHYNSSTLKWEINSHEGIDGPMVNVNYLGATRFAEWAGGRLPTEAEWEYACRGPWTGDDTPLYYTGNDITTADANYVLSGILKPVGKRAYPPNPLGLYNMAGNVSEFCFDGYNHDYGLTSDELATTVFNPMGPRTYTLVVIKGGSYYTDKRYLQSAERAGLMVLGCLDDVGFRIVKPL